MRILIQPKKDTGTHSEYVFYDHQLPFIEPIEGIQKHNPAYYIIRRLE